MLRRQFLAMAAAAAIGTVASMPAMALTEGTDYVVLENPVPNAENTVIKVFSYDCPFCFKYAQAVDKAVLDQVPEMQFTPFHLRTKGKYGIQGSQLLAVALVKDEAAGLKPLDPNSNFHKVEMGLYNAYHVKKERWDDGADAFIDTGLKAAGWDRAQFDKDVQDPKVQALIERWEVSYPIAKIQGVPAYVVNGKYLLKTARITSLDGMAASIRELSAKK